MKIIIEASPKEMADFIREVQSQPGYKIDEIAEKLHYFASMNKDVKFEKNV